MHYEEFVQEEPIDQVHCFEMDVDFREENKAHVDQAINIIPESQTPSLGESTARQMIQQQKSTVNSSKPDSNILHSERAGMMLYDELEQDSQQQQMKILGAEL